MTNGTTVTNTGDSTKTGMWLASRCICNTGGGFEYEMRYTHAGGSVTVLPMLRYDGTNYEYASIYAFKLRPCVEIDLTNVHIGITGTGTSDSPYSITAR